MRRTQPVALWTLLLTAWCVSLVSADIIPQDSHPVAGEVTITNLDRFPNFVLVGYVTGPMIETHEVYLIEENQPLTKGYKFNSLRLFAIESTALANVGGLAGIDFQAVCQEITPADVMDPYRGYVSNANPLASEHYYYEVESVSAQKLVLRPQRKVSTFNDGQADRIVEY